MKNYFVFGEKRKRKRKKRKEKKNQTRSKVTVLCKVCRALGEHVSWSTVGGVSLRVHMHVCFPACARVCAVLCQSVSQALCGSLEVPGGDLSSTQSATAGGQVVTTGSHRERKCHCMYVNQ